MQHHSATLVNSLTVVGETNPAARSVAVGFFVQTGSRDETPDISGVTHFLEHMIFKGTPRRSALEVNRDFDRIGAQYNAFTSEENTVFYAAVLPEYLPQAVEILADILRPSLRQDDFDSEKQVILEEIGMYEDQPGSMAYEHAKRIFFDDHPLGQSILGTPASVTALTREQMAGYFQRRYVPAKIAAVAAGRFDWKPFVGLLQEHCGEWQPAATAQQYQRTAGGSGRFEVIYKADVAQEHVFVVIPAPPVSSNRRYAADILATVLGDDSGSRLYWALVHPGYVESASCGFHEYYDTGAYYLSFTCDPGRTARNVAIVQGLLEQAQQEGITEEELKQAKSKVMSRVVRAGERPMGRMQAIGMTHVYLNTYHTVDEELRHFSMVSRRNVRELLERYPLVQTTTLALGPLQKLRRSRENGSRKR